MNIEFIRACGNNDIDSVNDWIQKCRPHELDSYGHGDYYPYNMITYRDVNVYGSCFVKGPDTPVSQLWLSDTICVSRSYEYGLLLACNNGYLDLVKILYNYIGGEELNYQVLGYCMEMDFCEDRSNTNVIQFLLENTKLRIDTDIRRCILRAAIHDRIDLVEVLLSYMETSEITTEFYNAVLDRAVTSIAPKVVEWALEKCGEPQVEFIPYLNDDDVMDAYKVMSLLLANVPDSRDKIISRNVNQYKYAAPLLYEKLTGLLEETPTLEIRGLNEICI